MDNEISLCCVGWRYKDKMLLKGIVSKDHMHIEYRPSQDISSLVKLLKGRSSRKLQVEFPELKKRYSLLLLEQIYYLF